MGGDEEKTSMFFGQLLEKESVVYYNGAPFRVFNDVLKDAEIQPNQEVSDKILWDLIV